MNIKDIYKKIKSRISPPTTPEGIWEYFTESEKAHYKTRENFLNIWETFQKLATNPNFTVEATYQAFGIKGKVICGFPGIGKSTLFKELKDSDFKVLDSDSSTFDKAHFPDNYIKYIKEETDKGYTILASSHDVVRDALLKEKMLFTLVYPDKTLKEEYLKRYKERGSPEAFVKLLDSNWDKWIGQCDDLNSDYVHKVKLKAGEFIDAKKAGIIKEKPLKEDKMVKTQKEMIAQMDALLKGDDVPKLYKKSGTFDARKGKTGEHIVTTIDGEDETQKTVKDGEVVIKGPKGEFYVVSEKKFKERYEVDKDLSDSFQKYKAKGLIRAYEYTGPTVKFIASWDEEMLCKEGDFLACPVADKDEDSAKEVYRIERSVFDETYKLDKQ